MASEPAASRRAPPFIDPPGYARHRPEATLLYRLVEQHYPALLAVREAAGRPLPGYVQKEFKAYLKCGRLEHGFLRVRCEDWHAEKLVAFSCKGRGFCPSCGARRLPGDFRTGFACWRRTRSASSLAAMPGQVNADEVRDFRSVARLTFRCVTLGLVRQRTVEKQHVEVNVQVQSAEPKR